MFKDMKEVTNVFKTGTVCIDITECFCPPTHWNPSDCTRKIVHICNEGTKAVYVRVKLIPHWDCGLPTNNVTFEPCDHNWICVCGWYYYKKILGSDVEVHCNAKCVTMDMNVKLSGCSGDEYQGKMFTLTVKVEAIQAKHNSLMCDWGLTTEQMHHVKFECYPAGEDDCNPNPCCPCDEGIEHEEKCRKEAHEKEYGKDDEHEKFCHKEHECCDDKKEECCEDKKEHHIFK
jgi:hypothetical protein